MVFVIATYENVRLIPHSTRALSKVIFLKPLNDKTMLRIKEYQRTYYGQVHALRNVSLHLAEGEIVTLIGANGAGKTTLLNTLSGIVPPKAVKSYLKAFPIAALAPHRIVEIGISQVPEGRQVFNPLSRWKTIWSWALTCDTKLKRARPRSNKP